MEQNQLQNKGLQFFGQVKSHGKTQAIALSTVQYFR